MDIVLQVLITLISILPILVAAYRLVMKNVTEQLADYAAENAKLRSENTTLQDELYISRGANDELENELKKKVADLTASLNELQKQVEKLTQEIEDKDALIDFFQNQADKNNQIAIEERERRVKAETKLEQTLAKIEEWSNK